MGLPTRSGYTPEMQDGRGWTITSETIAWDVTVSVAPCPGAVDAPLVVLLHGMGESGRTAADAWPRVLSLPVHVVAPDGPFGFEIREGHGVRIGRAWYLYDGDGPEFRRTYDAAVRWVLESVARAERRHGLRPRARAVIGYSQGGYLAYGAALRGGPAYDRLVAVAGRLKEEFLAAELAAPSRLSALLLHGRDDRAVPPDASVRSHRVLLRAGCAAELRLLPGGHGLRSDRDDAAARWLAAAWNLPRPADAADG